MPDKQSMTDTKKDFPSRSVLLVENHEQTCLYLKDFLERTGYKVVVSKGAANTLELPDLDRFDIILSDISLADGDGWSLMRAIRPRTKAYAVAMSGFGMKADIDQSFAAGYQEHLVKPFTPAKLQEALSRHEKSSRSRQEVVLL